jgi:hypothetical protein
MESRKTQRMPVEWVIALSLLFGAGPATSPSVDAPPIAHFSFEVGSEDRSDGGAKAELANAPITDKTLRLNGIYGMGEDGKSYKAIFNVPKLDYHEFTVAWRFRANDFDGDHANLIAGGKGYRWLAVTRLESGLMRVELNSDLHDHVARHDFKDTKIQAGEWNTIACAVDLPAKRVSIRLNDEKASTFLLPSDFKLSVIGGQDQDKDRLFSFVNYSCGRTFSGEVSDLVVMPRALSEVELDSLHSEPGESKAQ